MTRTKSTFLALVAVLLSPIAANADLISIEATASPFIDISDFSLVYDDTGDGLLQWNEVVSFSGVTFLGVFYDYLASTPDLAGISTFSADPALSPFFAGFCAESPLGWCVGQTSGEVDWRLFNTNWSYVVTAVPEPGTLALVGIGLLGMGAARRRRIVSQS